MRMKKCGPEKVNVFLQPDNSQGLRWGRPARFATVLSMHSKPSCLGLPGLAVVLATTGIMAEKVE
jgi:hypothetical protein